VLLSAAAFGLVTVTPGDPKRTSGVSSLVPMW
jgi:hypothetical protein